MFTSTSTSGLFTLPLPAVLDVGAGRRIGRKPSPVVHFPSLNRIGGLLTLGREPLWRSTWVARFDKKRRQRLMSILRRRSRHRLVAGSILAGAVMAAMSVTTPAWAKTTSPANHIIVGSGSSTTYNMMQSLDTLFNDSLGCYMTQPTGTQQTLNFSCASNNQGQQVGEGYTENPVNDVAVEEPALGSSAGIEQVEAQGTGNDNGAILPSAPVNFGRSSRAFASTDYPGLNFVGYATDGVSYF